MPPSMRVKVGVGTYVIALLAPSAGRSAEQDVFDALFIQELRILESGFLVSMTNQLPARSLQSMEQDYIYILAELCVHSYDTKALQKVLHVHGPGSRVGCPLCKGIGGQYRSPLKKIVHLGHR